MARLTTDVRKLLRERYKSREWAFFEEVGDAAGYHKKRTADGLAMNLWPSRGLTLLGFEIKVSRSDWKHELENPKKAEEGVFRYCDHWFIVAGDSNIVREGELPPTWGLINVVDKNDNPELQVAVEAPKLDPLPLDREFVAAVLRRAATWISTGLATTETFQDGYDKGMAAAQALYPSTVHQLQQEVTSLRKFKEDIEKQCDENFFLHDLWQFTEIYKVLKQWWCTPYVFRSLDMGIDTLKRETKRLQEIREALLKVKLPRRDGDVDE